MYRKRFRFPVMVLLCFLLFSWKTAESPTASAEALGGTPPTTLVSSGVTNFNLAEPRVVWHTSANCTEPPGLVAEGAAPEDPEIISRIPNYGGLIRQIFYYVNKILSLANTVATSSKFRVSSSKFKNPSPYHPPPTTAATP